MVIQPAMDGAGEEHESRLVKALAGQTLVGEVALAGRWVTLRHPACAVHVVQSEHGRGYLTWCDHPAARTVECYREPEEAIAAGLQRAAALLTRRNDA